MSGNEITSSLFAASAQAVSSPKDGEPGSHINGHIVRVAVESSGADAEFDYLAPEGLGAIHVGQRVEVPFGKSNKLEAGFCVRSDVPAAESFAGPKGERQLKCVARVIDEEPLLGDQLMELANWIGDYYVCPLGQVLAALVPRAVKRAAGIKKRRYVYLGPAWEEMSGSLKGPKQKGIVAVLRERQAFTAEAAVEVSEVLEIVGCGQPAVKHLADGQIVRIVQKKVFANLPIVPEGMLTEAAQQITLNDDQQKALEHISEQIESGRFSVTLLHGVTDSGKTEIYIRAIEQVVRKGKAAIVLLRRSR
jgi:primosomal protein N' (replication factor Y)